VIRSEQPKSIDAADLPLSIGPERATAGYLQLANQLKALIDSRALRAGTKLPPSRALTRTLGMGIQQYLVISRSE
jgi:hypothetical protein